MSLVYAGLCGADPAAALSFAGLGDLPGGDFDSFVNGISADGSTVVGFSESTAGGRAFRWDATNGMQSLGDPPGGATMSAASAASGDGSVIVGSLDNEPFIWDAVNGMVPLGHLTAQHAYTTAGDVSVDGSLVVGMSYRQDVHVDAFRWDAANGMTAVGSLVLGGESDATAVSAAGDVIVGTSQSAAGFEAYAWNATNGMTGIGDALSAAFGVSSDGSTIVGQRYPAAGGEAFVWDAVNGLVGLGGVPDYGNGSAALDVSGDGRIVVGTSTSSNIAFIWDATNGMRTLESELAALGIVVPSGWILAAATAISDDGRTIAGYGTNPNGDREGWVATIPEPEPALPLALGLVAMTSLRRISRRTGAAQGS